MPSKDVSDVGEVAEANEQLEVILPDEEHRADFLRLMSQLTVDDEALVVLKGHLIVEEKLDEIIEAFVFHPEQLEAARLSFAQKVVIARSLSLDEHENTVWDLILKLNTLRNRLAHSLDGTARDRAMEALRVSYSREFGGKPPEETDVIFLTSVATLSLGFLGSFLKEVNRLRKFLSAIDPAINPHRHKSPAVRPHQSTRTQAADSTG
jgi:hypothetical protein